MGAEGQAIQDALAKKLGKSRVTVPQVSLFFTLQLLLLQALDHMLTLLCVFS